MIDEKYNYHSHTYRCGHAADVSDKFYLDIAVEQGFDKYGITDHAPLHPIFYPDSKVRMHDIEKDEYLLAMINLKREYEDQIQLFFGFEAEYDYIIEDYLCKLRDKSDYMILGQHYVLDKYIRNSPIYPIEYAKKVCQGIESGIFDMVAHPDIFMQYRKDMISSEDKALFLKNALTAAEMICVTAKQYNVPLELNLGRISSILLEDDVISVDLEDEIDYPTNLFWKIVIEHGNDVVVGIDAHFPEDIKMRDEKLKLVSKYIDLSKVNFLPNSYNPVTARENNYKLQTAYQQTKSNLSCVESRIVVNILDNFSSEKGKRRLEPKDVGIEIIKVLSSKTGRKHQILDVTSELTLSRRRKLISIVERCFLEMTNKKNMSIREIKEILIGAIERTLRD